MAGEIFEFCLFTIRQPFVDGGPPKKEEEDKKRKNFCSIFFDEDVFRSTLISTRAQHHHRRRRRRRPRQSSSPRGGWTTKLPETRGTNRLWEKENRESASETFLCDCSQKTKKRRKKKRIVFRDLEF